MICSAVDCYPYVFSFPFILEYVDRLTMWFRIVEVENGVILLLLYDVMGQNTPKRQQKSNRHKI